MKPSRELIRMKLVEVIKEQEEINDPKLPAYIRRRIDFQDENILKILKGWVMRFHGKVEKRNAIASAFHEVTTKLMEKIDDDKDRNNFSYFTMIRDLLKDLYLNQVIDFYKEIENK